MESFIGITRVRLWFLGSRGYCVVFRGFRIGVDGRDWVFIFC